MKEMNRMECMMDFPHAAVWCPACHAAETQSRIAGQMQRANDLKEQELELLSVKEWVEHTPRVVTRNTLPQRPQRFFKGGIDVGSRAE